MTHYPPGTAAAEGLASCHICGTLGHPTQTPHCPVCRSPLHLRKPYSVQRCLAFLLVACILYIPANLLPIMETEELGRVTANTIAGGVVRLWHHGSYPIAIVIFVASVMVPVLKMLALGWLCWCVNRPGTENRKRLGTLYNMTELVGKWSMVDVFVVALLVALIQLETLFNIMPGPAAVAFAGVVIFTMLSAMSFDPRLIWDRETQNNE